MEPIPRTCTEIKQNSNDPSLPLKAFRTEAAYVLLGDPGSGKSTEFEIESNDLGDEAILVSARDFLTFDIASRPEWRRPTIFIDGLDEVRATYTDSRTPFDCIRKKLDNLGSPFFRISCREADWLGENDRKHLAAVSSNSQVKMLRLDPLRGADIDDILTYKTTINDIEAFKQEAQKRNLGSLLFNPQNLLLLAKSVSQEGNWPKSRLDTFEKACQQLVIEHNEEHGQQSHHQILDIAGYLCAVQLISGTAGYSLNHNRIDDNYLALDNGTNESLEMYRQTLSTKLFKASTVDKGFFTPIHRHIAEFLAARHLTRLIKDGLPAARVISLIVSEDGDIISGFRGLSAWLAAHSNKVRFDLIERDTVGVGLYGDIRGFLPHEKLKLLKHLNYKITKIADPKWQIAEAFAPLASPEMEAILLDIFTKSNRNNDHQNYVYFLLEILQRGTPLPSTSQACIEIVRDSSWNTIVSSSALKAFIYNSTGDITDELTQLSADVQNNNPADPDYYLSNTLLGYLYPQNISPSEVWTYIDDADNKCYDLRYSSFWKYDLIDKSTDENIAELLDHLYEKLPELKEKLIVSHLKILPIILLTRGLYLYGEELNISRLYRWLKVGLLCDRWPYHFYATHIFNEDPTYNIRFWLEDHPEVQKELILEGLISCSKNSDLDEYIEEVAYYLYDSELPSDTGVWSLKKSIDFLNVDPQISEYLLRISVDLYSKRVYDQGLSRSVLFNQTRNYPVLKEQLVTLLDQYDSWKQEDVAAEHQDDKAQWIANLQSNLNSLRDNTNHTLLRDLGKIYYGLLSSQEYGNTSLEYITEFFDHDDKIIETVLSVLVDIPKWEDTPDSDEIISLNLKGKVHSLMYPFLAGIDEIMRIRPAEISQLADSQVRKAVAFYYSTRSEVGKDGYSELVKKHHKQVADTLLRYAKSKFRSSKSGSDLYDLIDSGLYNLTFTDSHASIANQISQPLLKYFPIRCTQKQIKALDYLLWSALQHTDGVSLCELIRQKLSYSSMNISQRIHWLAAGFVISSDEFSTSLETLVSGKDNRLRQLAAFFATPHSHPILIDKLQPTELALLIKLLGPSFNPSHDPISFKDFIKPSEQIAGFVEKLGSLPNKVANETLKSLSADPALYHWHDKFNRVLDAQRVLYQNAIFRYPKIEQIRQTLSNQAPANPADLAALLVDRLNAIAVRIRTSNTDDWRQYWNEDSYGRPETPKNEDSCRDALLSDLRGLLPEGVDAQPEGQYANDKRADMRVSYHDFNVPVEAKKTTHSDLWSALHSQLIKKYTNDPKTGGYGIYLVFWVGGENSPPPPQGKRPTNAQELRERLQATLETEESRKITVCVVDVSKHENSSSYSSS